MELTPYSAKGMRPLSRFHAEEMLYEYVQGELDPQRTRALEEYLKTDEELQVEVVKLQQGLGYLNTLSSGKIVSESIERIRVSNNWTDRITERLRVDEWPAGLKLGLESITVVSAIFVIAIAVPWNSLFEVIQDETGSQTLAEIRRDFKAPGATKEEFAEATLMEMVKDVVFDDEGVPEAELPNSHKAVAKITDVPQLANPADAKLSAAVTAAATVNATGGQPPLQAAPSLAQSPTVAAAATAPANTLATATTSVNSAAIAVQKRTTANEASASAAKTEKTSGSQDPVLNQGFLYRGVLRTTNVEAVTPKIVEFLAQGGGRKAGQVDLGWRKGTGSYFHFTIPEAKYEELEEFFREYGTLVISKERHPKVMPEGIVRLIVDVEEKTTP